MKTNSIRCESMTTKGTRCRLGAYVYVRHTDGHEYLSCHRHESEFTPCREAKLMRNLKALPPERLGTIEKALELLGAKDERIMQFAEAMRSGDEGARDKATGACIKYVDSLLEVRP